MWLFNDFGLLMPVITEENDPLRFHPEWNRYTNDGEFTFQVRVRIFEHAEYFLDNFMEEGTHGEIMPTPDHDYNFRFFCTQEAFAQGVAKSVMAIDYRNFKDKADRYPWGAPYHKLLLSIWSDSCDLATPGGTYGPWSEENPGGYRPSSRYYSWGDNTWYDDDEWVTGQSFGNIDFGDDKDVGDDGSWEPTGTFRTNELISMLDTCGIHHEDWADFLDESEWVLVRPEAEKRTQADKKEHRAKKKNRRKGKKAAYSKN